MDFGNVSVGDMVSKTCILSNPGLLDATVLIASNLEKTSPFSLAMDRLPLSIAAGSKTQFSVNCKPTDPSKSEEKLNLQVNVRFSDPNFAKSLGGRQSI